MNGTQVRVLEQTNQVRLCRFLKSKDGSTLKAQISLEILSDFAYQTLEGCLADQQIGGLLILADLTKGDSSRTVSVGLLDTPCGGSRLASCFGSKLELRVERNGKNSKKRACWLLLVDEEKKRGHAHTSTSTLAYLLARSFSSGGFTGSLLGACHVSHNTAPVLRYTNDLYAIFSTGLVRTGWKWYVWDACCPSSALRFAKKLENAATRRFPAFVLPQTAVF